VVLHHVADGAGLFVESAPALHAEALRHRDLHALDMAPVPDGLQEPVRETEEQHVLHGRLAQVVVDAEDPVLGEATEQDGVELARRGQVAAERLLDDHARAIEAARAVELVHHDAELRRRDGEVIGGTARGSELAADGLEGGRVLVAPAHVAHEPGQLRERRGVEAAVLLEALLQPRPELLDGFAADADDGHVEATSLHHRVQRGEDLLGGQVSRRAKEDEGVRCLAVRCRHLVIVLPIAACAFSSACHPPPSAR